MRKLLINLFLLCTGKDGIAMMAMLWAQEIMNQETVEDAKKMYERVPRILKTNRAQYKKTNYEISKLKDLSGLNALIDVSRGTQS